MSKFRAKLGVAAVLPLLVLSTPALPAEKIDTLRFGLLPAEDALEMVKQFQGIADAIGKTMGLPTKVWVSQSYNALIEAMRAGHVDVVYLGGSQYVAAKQQGLDVVPLVVAKTPNFPGDTVGRTYYKASIIVRSDSNIKNLQDLKGKTFAFVAPTSTSGGVGPRFFLIKNGLDPEKDFKSVLYAGKHDSVFLAVKNAKVEAGGVGDVYFARWKERGILGYSEYDEPNDALKDSEIRVLGGQKVPGTVMVARGTLGPEFVNKLQNAFTQLPLAAVDRYRIWGPTLAFVATSHKDFEELAEMEKLAQQLEKEAEKKKQ